MYTRETLENLLDLMPEYIFYRDKEGKNIYCNKSYAKNLVGLSKDEIYGKSSKDIPVLDKVYKVGRAKDLEVIESKESTIYEMDIIANDGNVHDLEILKYPSFDENGEVNGILGVMKDISYRRELDKLREGFFSNVRHEFRTPLNMILCNIQLLQRKCYDCDKCDKNSNIDCNSFFKRNIEQIYNNSLRLLKLSNNFIDLTNLQVGGCSFSPRNYDIVSCTESICENINDYKNFKGINITFDTDVEELILNFDYLKVERVLLNIISNAIKFNKEDGEILVSIISNEDTVKIIIKDTGVGIEEEKLPNIFNTFSSVEDRFTKISEGSGVGLALSKQLIKMHRGSINIKSEVSVGTEVIISLPNIYEEDEEIDMTFLKVEDDSMSRIKMELSDIYY